MPALNHQLTEILKGKTITGTSDGDGKKTVTFSDESVMTVNVKETGANSASTGGTIAKVRQDDAIDKPTLHLDMDGGATLDLDLAAPTSSVMLRSKDGDLLYAD